MTAAGLRPSLVGALLAALLLAACGARTGLDVPQLVKTKSAALWVSVSAGSSHTCAIRDDGRLSCWGSNHFGQLGDGTTTDHALPTAVADPNAGVTMVTTGTAHTCALFDGGLVRCWGLHTSGELGTGSSTKYDPTIPQDVTALEPGVREVHAADQFTCALTARGAVMCWGANGGSQIDSRPDRPSVYAPEQVAGLESGVKTLTTGGYHACALFTSGALKCWGSNEFGELGNTTPLSGSGPIEVAGLEAGVTEIAAGSQHTCALSSAGRVQCWGFNNVGQLGDGSTRNSTFPVEVMGLPAGVAHIATTPGVGGDTTCATTRGGAVLCWGFADPTQWLRSRQWTPADGPVTIPGLGRHVSQVAIGSQHACALDSEGQLDCWGTNESGQLGNGSLTASQIPVRVPGL